MGIAAAIRDRLLRHYADPASWGSIVVNLLAVASVKPDAGLVANIDAILAAVVGIVLWFIDGRKNPHVDPATGAIPERVQIQPPAAPRVPADAGPHVSPDSGTLVRQPDDPGPKPVGIRPGINQIP